MGTKFQRFDNVDLTAECRSTDLEIDAPVHRDDALDCHEDVRSDGGVGRCYAHVQSVRAHLRDELHSKYFQIVIIALVVVDCILVIAELMIDLEILKFGEDDLNALPHVLHYISITILGVFVVEFIVKVFAMGREFFRHKLEMFDAVVVLVSFSLDIAYAKREDAFSAVGLLVVLRLWRVTRIVNGIVISVQTQAERKVDHMKKQNQALKDEVMLLRQSCKTLEKEVAMLRETVRRNGLPALELSPASSTDDLTQDTIQTDSFLGDEDAVS